MPAPPRTLIEIDCGEHAAASRPTTRRLLEIARAARPGLAGVMTHAGHSYAGRCAAGDAPLSPRPSAARRGARRGAAGRGRATPCRSSRSAARRPRCTPASPRRRHRSPRRRLHVRRPVPGGDRHPPARRHRRDGAGQRDRPATGRAGGDRRCRRRSRCRRTAAPRRRRATTGSAWCWTSHGRPQLRRRDRAAGVAGARAWSSSTRRTRRPAGRRPKVRIAPNHACMTAAAHDRYFVVDGGDDGGRHLAAHQRLVGRGDDGTGRTGGAGDRREPRHRRRGGDRAGAARRAPGADGAHRGRPDRDRRRDPRARRQATLLPLDLLEAEQLDAIGPSLYSASAASTSWWATPARSAR